MPTIHPTAIISAEACLAEDVAVGPFTIIDGPVTIGAGSRIGPHCHLIGPLTLGCHNTVHAGCVLGEAPQHLGYKGEPTPLTIGDHNIFREHVTIHRGMPNTHSTSIGDHNFLMVGSHIAHDVSLGNHCIFANCAVVGGHAEIQDRVLLSGNSAVHQHCRVGTLALVGGTTAISMDLPPFWIVQGEINVVKGVNILGMRRAGYSSDEISAVRRAYRLLYRSGLMISEAVDQMEQTERQSQAVQLIVAFIRESKRGICMAKREHR